MAYALVGSQGAVVQSASGGAVSGLAYGQAPTANNLLIARWAGDGAATLPSTPAGWSSAVSRAGTSCAAQVFYKVAAGGDAVPTFGAITSSVQTVLLAEFSGNATTTPLDQFSSAAGTSTPLHATFTVADTAAGELVVGAVALFYSTAATKTISWTAAVVGDTPVVKTSGTSDASLSTVSHYLMAYEITTSSASADDPAVSFTTTKVTGVAIAAASFLLAGGAPVVSLPDLVMAPPSAR